MLKNATSIPNIPFEEMPKGWTQPLWRSKLNPIIKRNPAYEFARVYNSALVKSEDGFVGVFRVEDKKGIPHLHLGRSRDGIHMEFEKEPIYFVDEDGKPMLDNYAYDPRFIVIEGVYYVVWCADFHGPALAIAKSTDLKTFTRCGNPFLPFNRNGVLFPRKVNGEYLMLSRPSDSGHTAFGDIFLSKSKDMVYWGKHAHVMERGYEWWNSLKVGAGCNPIETSEGWLLFFHGVAGTCNGYVYSLGAVVLDLDDPSKVKYRCSDYLLTPEEDYETTGFVPNVIFPTSALVDKNTGRIAIYYGAADTYTCLAFTTIERVMDFIKSHRR